MFASSKPFRSRPSRHAIVIAALAATVVAGCDSDEPTTPTAPTPTQITEQFGTADEPLPLNPNGARTHSFTVQQTGQVSAVLTALSAEGVAVGLSLGTWNGAACQIIIANDNLIAGQAVTGTANGTGIFCVRIYDVGNLAGNVQYAITVTHF